MDEIGMDFIQISISIITVYPSFGFLSTNTGGLKVTQHKRVENNRISNWLRFSEAISIQHNVRPDSYYSCH